MGRHLTHSACIALGFVIGIGVTSVASDNLIPISSTELTSIVLYSSMSGMETASLILIRDQFRKKGLGNAAATRMACEAVKRSFRDNKDPYLKMIGEKARPTVQLAIGVFEATVLDEQDIECPS